MIWLQSKNEYDCLAEFDPATGGLRKHSRRTLGVNAPDVKEIVGSFADIKSGLLVLFQSRGRIVFWASGKEFELDGQTIVDVHGSGCKKRLTIKTNGAVVHDLDYELANDDAISDDPTAFVDGEDYDFGVFVSNISKDKDRRDVLLGK